MTTVAIIQPYFMPYAGYFRLYTAADVVVLFDCVQFPRRGWVHRNRFELASGSLDWLTLPIASADRQTRISEIRFRADAADELGRRMRRFPLLARAPHSPLWDVVRETDSPIVTYLERQLGMVTARLQIARPTIRSSTLQIAPELRGQERVIAIARTLGATRYVNPSGGRALYDARAFERCGLELRFLAPYVGSMQSILTRLLVAPTEELRGEIARETVLEP